MADVTAVHWSVNPVPGSQGSATVRTYSPLSATWSTQTEGLVRRLTMVWVDVDALPSIVYRTWVVTDYPDPTGAQYTGAKSGATAISGAFVMGRSDQ